MTSLLRPENVINIKYIVTILIVKSIILHTLARLCEDSARVSRRLVFEARIANAICRR
jgi:hypothetical protein